jgi:uncharacterized membrane protein YkvA (DUF1232 family)
MGTWLSRFGLLRALSTDIRVAIRLCRDPRVSWWVKAVPLAAVLYILSPIDLLPDVFPALGQLDDLGVLVVGLKLFLRLSPAAVVAFHRDELQRRQPYSSAPSPDVIEAEFRRG